MVVDLCVDLFFFCDIVVNFRTTYIGKNDALVTDPKKIALRYLRTYFIVDLVAAIPWDLIAVPAHGVTMLLTLSLAVGFPLREFPKPKPGNFLIPTR